MISFMTTYCCKYYFFLIEISYNYQCCTLLQVYKTSCLVKFISLTLPYTMYHTKRVFICVMSPETDIYACSFSYATYVWPENIEKNKVLFCSVLLIISFSDVYAHVKPANAPDNLLLTVPRRFCCGVLVRMFAVF